MFSWARKERLAERGNTSFSAKSCQDTTEVQSYPSSPAHSAFSINSPSRSKYTTPQKKLKVVLYNREKEKSKKVLGQYAANLSNTISKTQLMSIINSKNSQSAKKSLQDNPVQAPGHIAVNHQHSHNKKSIKIKIEVNRFLDEYCRAARQILSNNLWNIFGIALILLKMGFIQDLVNQRNIVREIWVGLDEPDKLGFYVFLEQVLGNRVQVQLAIKGIVGQIGGKMEEVDKEKAVAIIVEKKCQSLYEYLKLNRLARQKRQQPFA